MPDNISITGRPQLPTGQQQRGMNLGVQVSQPSQGGPLPGPDQRLQGLLDGLSAFNPVLNQMAAQKQQQLQQSAIDQAQADAQKVEHPVDALTGDPVQRPSVVPPAYDADYRRSYGIALAHRAALDNKAKMATAYEDEKNSPDFNLDNFLQGWRQTALQGVKDPLLQAAIGTHLGEVEAGIRNDYTGLQVQRHEEQRTATAFQLADGFTGDKSPQELAHTYLSWYLPQVNAIQIDKKQAAGLFLQKLQALSDAGKGRPELFDAMLEKDSEGLSILSRNPQLQGTVLAAKQRAQDLHDKVQHEATEKARFTQLAGFEDDAVHRPESIDMNTLAAAIGPDGLSAERAASIWHTAQVTLAQQAASADLDDHARKGELGMYPEEVQKSYLNNRFEGAVNQLWDAAVHPDQAPVVAGLAQALMQAQSHYGATVTIEPLQRLVDKTVNSLPNPQGPDSGFTAAAAIYASLGANQQFRDMYFKGNAAKVMEAYTQKVQTGVDAKTAYDHAYRTIDPDVIAAARKRAEAPEMQSKIASLASKAAEGSSFVPRIVGGNGRPTNTDAIGVWASSIVRQALTDNPDLDDKEIQDMVDRQAAKNWAMDTTSNQAVKVPPGIGGNLSQAISEFSADAAAAQKADGKWPDGSVIRYIPLDTQGTYRVQARLGSRTMDLDTITAQQLLTRSAMKHTMTKEEGLAVGNYLVALRTGKPVPDVDPAIIGKGIFTGAIDQNDLARLKAQNGQRLMDRVAQVPSMTFGTPSGNYTEVPKRGGAVVDNQLTASIADGLFRNAGLVGSPITGAGDNTLGIAASLTAVREGIALKAYADPARGAGMNLGAGYNLNAHKATVDSDLKRAGVPEDRLEDVKSGKAQLTPNQASRLVQVALGPYAAATKTAAEAAAPGLWDKMTPPQRAVMIDLAYQTGDAAKFKNAWAALAKGDTETFAKEVHVTYPNHAGETVVDTRGADLRASVLAGASVWKARMQLLAGRPSNPIQSAAMTTGNKQ